MKHQLLIILLPVLLASCQTIEIEIDPRSYPAEAMEHESKRRGSWVFGLLETGTPLEPNCAAGASKAVIRRDAVDFAIHFFVGGIYTTRSVSVECFPPARLKTDTGKNR